MYNFSSLRPTTTQHGIQQHHSDWIYDSKKLIFPRISLAGLTEVLDVTGNHKLEVSQVQPSQYNQYSYNNSNYRHQINNDQVLQETWNVIHNSNDTSTVHYYIKGKKHRRNDSQNVINHHIHQLPLDDLHDSGETMTSL